MAGLWEGVTTAAQLRRLVSANLSLTWGAFCTPSFYNLAVTLYILIFDVVAALSAATSLNHLAFLQFSRVTQANFALLPYFFGPAHFSRIMKQANKPGTAEIFSRIF